ncbi:MAG: hypothetical protein NTW05_12440, partial [Pseudonocardiales bacterium]|nr:hypothetical protein [Pseudonocardiales bacterium]
ALAAVPAAAAVVLLRLPADGPGPALTGVAVAGVLAFAAVIAAGPVLFPATAAVLGLPLAGLATGRFALRSARRAPRRATTTVAALTLLAMLLTAVLVGLQSMTVSAGDRIAARFPAPVTVVATGEAALPADLAARIAADPAAGAAVAVPEAVLGDGTRVTAVDPAAFPALLDGALDAGSLADLRPGTVALDRAAADARQVGVGGVLVVADGGVALPVVAVYRSSGVLGDVTVHPDDAAALAPGAAVRQVLAVPAGSDGGDAGVEALRGAVSAAVGPDPGAAVLVLAGLRAELEATVGLVRAIALGLVAATVLVGAVGVAVSLVLAVRERRREGRTLRALGLTPGQVVAATGLENGVLALAGAAVGTALGVLFGVLAVFALREPAVIPVDEVLAGSGTLVLVAVVAGTLPALGAARRTGHP